MPDGHPVSGGVLKWLGRSMVHEEHPAITLRVIERIDETVEGRSIRLRLDLHKAMLSGGRKDSSQGLARIMHDAGRFCTSAERARSDAPSGWIGG
jgi:hypothetical protein